MELKTKKAMKGKRNEEKFSALKNQREEETKAEQAMGKQRNRFVDVVAVGEKKKSNRYPGRHVRTKMNPKADAVRQTKMRIAFQTETTKRKRVTIVKRICRAQKKKGREALPRNQRGRLAVQLMKKKQKRQRTMRKND